MPEYTTTTSASRPLVAAVAAVVVLHYAYRTGTLSAFGRWSGFSVPGATRRDCHKRPRGPVAYDDPSSLDWDIFAGVYSRGGLGLSDTGGFVA